MTFDLVIKNGRYFDGSKTAHGVKHLGVINSKVVAVSESELNEEGAEVIDASGKWVCPGFIEPHAHYDAEVIVAPELSESVRHGITTVVNGLCSLSMVSCSPLDAADIFSRVEAVPRDIVLSTLEQRKTWSTPQEYADFLKTQHLGPNVATYLGHSDIRTSVMGLERSVDASIKATEDELRQMEAILEDALDAGFLGLSTMTTKLDKVHGDRAWSASLPSTYATWKEYRRLHRVLRKRGGILQSAPDAVGKVNIFLFLIEACGFFRKKLKTTMLTVLDLKAQPYLHWLGPMGSWFSNNVLRGDLQFQFLPTPLVFYADGLDFGHFEEFASGEVLRDIKVKGDQYAKILDPTWREEFHAALKKVLSAGMWNRDFSDAYVIDCPNKDYINKTFAEIGKMRNEDPVEAYLNVVQEHRDDLRWGADLGNHRKEVMEKLIANENVHVGFGDSGAHLRNLAFYHFPISMLAYVSNAKKEHRNVLTWEHAIHRLTGELGDWYGLDAGYLREGDRADIVILDPEGLHDGVWDYHEEYFEPFDVTRVVNRNDAVTHTIINGQLAYQADVGFTSEFGKTRGFGQYLHGKHVS